MNLQRMYDTTKVHFQEMTNGTVNVTELIAALICEKDNFVEGIQYVQGLIDGSMTLLLMTKDGIYAARDKMGRTPVEIGHKEGPTVCPLRVMPILIWVTKIIRNLAPERSYL